MRGALYNYTKNELLVYIYISCTCSESIGKSVDSRATPYHLILTMRYIYLLLVLCMFIFHSAIGGRNGRSADSRSVLSYSCSYVYSTMTVGN